MGTQGRRPPIFKGSFRGPEDRFEGKVPMVFDILGPDRETSILPSDYRLVLHVNPNRLAIAYKPLITRINTEGGWVEQHWGESPTTISCDASTGGFVRLYSGMSNITGGGYDVGGTRRETIAYDKFLDLLALFRNNGSVYDTEGKVVFQGAIKIVFDEGVFIGHFSSFNATEDAARPYVFSLSFAFEVEQEFRVFRSTIPGFG